MTLTLDHIQLAMPKDGEPPFAPAKMAHPDFQTQGPFGNRLEFLQLF